MFETYTNSSEQAKVVWARYELDEVEAFRRIVIAGLEIDQYPKKATIEVLKMAGNGLMGQIKQMAKRKLPNSDRRLQTVRKIMNMIAEVESHPRKKVAQ